MDDRELLEAAARAAGIEIEWHPGNDNPVAQPLAMHDNKACVSVQSKGSSST